MKPKSATSHNTKQQPGAVSYLSTFHNLNI